MFLKWFGALVGMLMGLAVCGLIVWMLGVKAEIWSASPGGFWVF